VVSTLAALAGKPAIALGNVIGSNIANIGLILGLTAVIAPPVAEGSLRTRELPVLLIATAAVPLVLLDGSIGRLDALGMLFGAVVFTYATLRWTEREPNSLADPDAGEPEQLGKLALTGLVAVGLVVLFVGGKAFVEGAVGVATWWGVDDRVVGLTVVALGTSLPELAASLVAAMRGHSELAVGNVVGSNILNILLIFGVTGLVRPIPGVLGDMALDMVLMGGLTLLCAIAIRRERRVSRFEGVLLLAGYLGFIGLLVRQSVG
jgi:cation:H+ antiporter